MDGVRLCERFNSEGRKMTEGQTAAVISLGRIIEHGSADNNEKNTRNTHKLLTGHPAPYDRRHPVSVIPASSSQAHWSWHVMRHKSTIPTARAWDTPKSQRIPRDNIRRSSTPALPPCAISASSSLSDLGWVWNTASRWGAGRITTPD
ncbi:hypothetical protein RRG08_003114 [Elysia crispata]|uniref:Uncharacterized protein n=1 Tax=Elysia crispata TaxID=231223 RepID=A0AAE1B6V5_9GAST|nr:hypothetical protein RRG08_003114 [Elysia crispata]